MFGFPMTPRTTRRATRGPLCAAALAWLLAGCAAPPAHDPWPDLVVPIEQMRTIGPLKTSVPIMSADRKGSSTVVLLVHVDAEGQPLRWKVQESSGNPRLDEAALHTMRNARFVPHRVAGAAREVTVVARFNYPFKDTGRR
jgi:protein TonB